MSGRSSSRPADARLVVQPITGAEFKTLSGPASMHALGHIAANLSFAAVAISLTHTVKTLEPAFNVLLSKLILGTNTPLPVTATLLPIMVRAPARPAHAGSSTARGLAVPRPRLSGVCVLLLPPKLSE